MSLFKKLALGAAIASLSFAATASEPAFTAGVKFGKLDITDLDGGTSKGLSLGYDFGNSFSVELDLLKGSADMDVEGYNIGTDVDTTAIYGTYRSEGKAYFLAKAGLLKEEAEACVMGECFSESDSGLSYGIGGGFRISDKFTIEAEYTIIESDVNFLGLGARMAF